MNKEELKNQAKNYISDNLDLLSALEVITDILNDIANITFYEGSIQVSNKINTALLIIKEVLDDER